jgi:hypothetical protein
MVSTLNIVEQNNMGLASLQTMIDLQAGTGQLQAWRGWYLPNLFNATIQFKCSDNTVALICGGLLFSQEKAFEEPLDAPCLPKSKGGGAPDQHNYKSHQPNH